MPKIRMCVQVKVTDTEFSELLGSAKPWLHVTEPALSCCRVWGDVGWGPYVEVWEVMDEKAVTMRYFVTREDA